MNFSKERTEKRLKKLSVWIKKFQKYRLFEIGKNAVYRLDQLMELPLAAALYNRSIEYECSIEGRPSPRDFYHHTNNKLTKEAIMKMHLRYADEVCKLLKNIFNKSTFDIAIDFTEDCFYGDKENHFVIGGERKNSTNYFFKYLTVAIVEKGFRFVIYSCPVSKDDNNDALLVENAIRATRKIINIRRILVDREFENSKICLTCDFYDIELVFPKKKDEKLLRWIETFRKESKKFPRIIEEYEVGDYPINVLLMEEENSEGKKEIYGYGTNIEIDKFRDDAELISEYYRERWAIENANKYQDAFNIHTNCTNGLVRYFFFVLTILLHNFWVLVGIFTKEFSLCGVSLNMIKEITKRILGLPTTSNYKDAQRQLLMSILVGQATT